MHITEVTKDRFLVMSKFTCRYKDTRVRIQGIATHVWQGSMDIYCQTRFGLKKSLRENNVPFRVKKINCLYFQTTT